MTNEFSELLSESSRRERSWEWVRYLIFWGAALGALGVYLWRCQFGVDLTDEAFYAAPAWKLFKLGDKPFIDEIFNGVRHSDLLNAVLISPWLPFKILYLRWAAVLLYGAILLWATVKFFGKNLGITAALAYVGCLTFDYFLMPTWSYNWWSRNFLLLHAIALLGRGRPVSLFFAGACLAIAVVAYNSLAPALVIGILAVAVVARKNAWAYLAGATVVLFPVFAYLLQPEVRPAWLLSIKAMSAMSEYSSNSAAGKLVGLVSYVLTLKMFWLLLILAVIFHSEVAWNRPLGKWGEKLTHARDFVFPVMLAAFTWEFFRHPDAVTTIGHMVAIGLSGAIVLLSWAWVQREPYWIVMVLVSAACSFGIALSSTNGFLAFFWILPSLIIPFAAVQTEEVSLRLRPWGQREIWKEGYGQVLVMLFLAVIARGSFHYQRTTTYYDVPPGNCDTRLSVAPLQGIKTSPRRAFLVEELERLTRNEKYVLAFADIPGPFLFGNVRPSVDTTIVEAEAPLATNQRSLRNMVIRERFPNLIIKAKVHPWYWGIHHPLAHIPMKYPVDDPYTRFADCARAQTIVDYEEFEAYRVAPERIRECASKATGFDLASAGINKAPTF